MSEEIFLLPDVGEGLTEAEIVEWKVNVGDVVTLNQPLVDIETAKATVELPSPYAGTVVALHGNVGDVLEVHNAASSPSTWAAVPAVPRRPPRRRPKAPKRARTGSRRPRISKKARSGEGREAVLIGYGVANEDAVVTRKHRRQSGAKPTSATSRCSARCRHRRCRGPGRLRSSTVPASRRDPRRPFASTPSSTAWTLRHSPAPAATDSSRAMTSNKPSAGSARRRVHRPRVSAPITGPNTTSRFVGRELESWATGPKEERIPVKGVLRSMAEAMVQSAFTQPRAAVWVRVDATRTMDLVASLKQQPNLANIRLSPLTIIALAVCDAARHFPGINSSFDAAANEVIVRRSVNLGIAADTPRGLIVPNIKGADQLDLVAMASALTVLVDKARAGTTTPNEMIGTTLSITNVGPFGVDAAIPILPPGTGAILAVGQIAKAPWVVNDEVVVRQVVELAMAFDHRQVDGAMASAVLSHIGRFLHDPAASIIAG